MSFSFRQDSLPVIYTDPTYGPRHMRLKAEPGQLTVRYDATVDIAHHFESPARLAEVAISQLLAEALPYIYPSRYCQSDRLHKLATREFGPLRQGYWRVQAVQDLFDPTGVVLPMGLVRLGTGRDAADVSFATMFGSIKSSAPVLHIEAIEANGLTLPRYCPEALSTHGEFVAPQ